MHHAAKSIKLTGHCTTSKLYAIFSVSGIFTVTSSCDARTLRGVQVGIERLPNLRMLFMSNNRVKDWAEVERLSGNTKLEELLLMGNPLTPPTGTPEYRLEASHP